MPCLMSYGVIERIQFFLIGSRSKIRLGNFKSGHRLFANQVGHLSEGAFAARPSLRAKERDLVQF